VFTPPLEYRECANHDFEVVDNFAFSVAMRNNRFFDGKIGGGVK
jgi:hypothetical protein